MTHPLSEQLSVKRFITTQDDFEIDLMQTMCRRGVMFYRQATPDGRGGGYVAENSYLPPDVALPWDCVVFENTRVFHNADFAGVGTRICGNTYRVSEVMYDYDRKLLCEAKRRRDALFFLWEQNPFDS